MEQKTEIFAAFSTPERVPLGGVWRITGKKTDFYLDSPGLGEFFHLSFHGPNDQNADHRFHIKHDRRAAKDRAQQSHFVAAGAFPRKGLPFAGEQMDDHAWRVARIRWLGEMQQPRFQKAAATRDSIPQEFTKSQSGVIISGALPTAYVADLDIFVSYSDPYWPDEESAATQGETAPSIVDNARVGPVANEAGMWLSAVSYKRPLASVPCPPQTVPRAPRPTETRTWIMCGSLETTAQSQIYWFTHAMTAHEVLAAWPADGKGTGTLFR